MSKLKISSVILYAIIAVSLVVMLFFFISPKTVNLDELENRIDELTTIGLAQDVADEPVADSLDTEEEVAVEEIAVVQEIDLRDHLSVWELMVYKRTDYALGWAYILLIITAIASLVFPLIYLATNLKAAVRVLALLAGAAVLFLLAYFLFASDTPIQITGYLGTDNSDPGTLKMVGTALFITYVLFGFAILSILYSEVSKLFK